MQQYKEAEEDIDTILQYDEENDEFLMMKGECCEALQKQEEAKACYTKVKTINP
jgi:tetratricopeptide (TPR) repeat protein